MPTIPAIGQHGSYNIGSDCYPCTVVEVSKSGHKIVVEMDAFNAGEGHDYFGQQNWVCVRREGGPRKEFTRRQNGRYVSKGSKCGSLSLGGWHAYRDPHF